MNPGTNNPSNRSIGLFRAGVFVTLGGALSLVLGFASQVVIAWCFGTSWQMDAFLTAIVIPTYIQSLLFTGLPFVLVPLFTRECVAGAETEAWQLVGTILKTSLTLTSFLAIVAASLAPRIIAVTAPGLNTTASTLASRMLAVLLFSLPFSVAGTLANGVQNARGDFLRPAAAPAVGALFNIATVLLFYRHIGAMSLAWGAFFAAVAQGCVSAIPVVANSWNRSVGLSDKRLQDILRLITPIIIFGTVGRATPVLERFFAASLPPGSISYLGYGAKIASIVQALIGTAVATAAFPAMARRFSECGKDGLKHEYRKVMRFTWGIILPVVMIGSACALPLVETLLVRGSFNVESAAMTAAVIPFLLATVFCNILGSNIGRALYVQDRTLGFNFLGALTIVLYPPLAWILVPHMGYIGLAVVGFIVNLLGVVAGYCLLRLNTRSDVGTALRYLGMSFIAAIATWAVVRSKPIATLPLTALILGSTVGCLVYLICLSFADRDLLAQFGAYTSRVLSRLQWGSADAN